MVATSYLVAGPAPAPAVVFVHGSALTHGMWQPQIEVLAARYPGPTLVRTGEHDRPNQRALPRLMASLQDGAAKTIPGAGHACNLERPDASTAAVAAFAEQVLG